MSGTIALGMPGPFEWLIIIGIVAIVVYLLRKR
jgi:hypothetical protein